METLECHNLHDDSPKDEHEAMSFTLSDEARKKVEGEIAPKKNKTKLDKSSIAEENWRIMEKKIDALHAKKWGLDEGYLSKLQARIDNVYTITPPDPLITEMTKCYKEEKCNLLEECMPFSQKLKEKVAKSRDVFLTNINDSKKHHDE